MSILSQDINQDDTGDEKGWFAIKDHGSILTFRGKIGWGEGGIGRGSSDQACPIHALEQYLRLSKIDFGLFVQCITRDDLKVTGDCFSDKHAACLTIDHLRGWIFDPTCPGKSAPPCSWGIFYVLDWQAVLTLMKGTYRSKWCMRRLK